MRARIFCLAFVSYQEGKNLTEEGDEEWQIRQISRREEIDKLAAQASL